MLDKNSWSLKAVGRKVQMRKMLQVNALEWPGFQIKISHLT